MASNLLPNFIVRASIGVVCLYIEQRIVLPIVLKLEAIQLLLDELVQVSRRQPGSASYFSKPVFPASEPDSGRHTPDQMLRDR